MVTVLIKKQPIVFLCSKTDGGNSSWQRLNTAGATILKSEGIPFIEMSRLVRYANAQCMLVMVGNKVVAEWNFASHKSNDRIQVASVSKSFAATLIGIAEHKGLLSLDEPASKYIGEWATGESSKVTIRQLLAMTSGRSDFPNLFEAILDVRSAVLKTTQVHPPGKVWFYNNASSQALEIVLNRASGEDVAIFAERELFRVLNMTTSMTLGPQGVSGFFAGVKATCLDVAKLVRLYLNGGSWNGVQVLSREFVGQALRPAVTSSEAGAQMNIAYGLQIWLNASGGSVRLPTATTTATVSQLKGPGPFFNTLPLDMFWFAGACHQTAAGLPSQNLVVIMLRPGCNSEQDLLTAKLDPAPSLIFWSELEKVINKK